MFRFLIIFVFCVLAGCASLASYFKVPHLALPNTASLPCCWQVLEQLDIKYQGEQFALSSVIVMNDDQLTVVILDALGRRIFSVIQQGDHIQVEKTELIKKDLPVEWLLIGVYLRHLSDNGWLFKDSHWRVKRDGEYVRLVQHGKTKVILYESAVLGDAAANVSVSQLQYPDLKLNINIITLLRQPLD